MAPLISIAVPTRDRGQYLRHCLETALRCDPRKVEVVVSDNASADASFIDDPRFARVKFVRQPHRIPMAANFEAAFANCSGDYILYVGDDDAVIPSGVADLIEVLEQRRPDIVDWPEPHYFWPDTELPGSLGIKRRHLRGGVTDRDPREVMQLVCGGAWGNDSIRCGCVARSIVDRIRSQYGRYFYYLNHDAAAYGALRLAKSYPYLNRPVTVYGRSSASHTTALASSSSAGHKIFVADNAVEAKPNDLSVLSRSVTGHALDGLLTTVRLLGLDDLEIDFARWKERIAGNFAAISEAEHAEQLAMVNDWLAKNGQSGIDPSAIAPLAKNASPKRRRPSLGKIELKTSPEFIGNVADAVVAFEYLVGSGSLARRESWPASAWRWAKLLARAKALTVRGALPNLERRAA